MGNSIKTFYLAFLSLSFFISSLQAQWSANPNVNNPICTAGFDQKVPTIISDGAGGAIITWEFEHSFTTYSDIYTQRINSSGIVQWTVDGLAISMAAFDQSDPKSSSDGAGGAIITWHDSRNGTNYSDIYAQHIDADGVVQWTADGVAISTAAYHQMNPTITSDGTGGAIITWWDVRDAASYDIYAQRIDANGVVRWTTDGVAISMAAFDQQSPVIIGDGSGGAIIAWEDYRRFEYDIFAQRIDSSGIVLWTADGVAISTAGDSQNSPVIVSDGAGGAIIAWQDSRDVTNTDIYAQRINAGGAVQWTANGVAISTSANNQTNPKSSSDGAGGAIITWQDRRSGTSDDLYAQRIDTSGVLQWTTDGVAISVATNNQTEPTITGDGSGGTIISWQDFRNGTNKDIYAQRIDYNGVVQWATDGVAISTAGDTQTNHSIVNNSAGGAIITWQDHRSGVEYDIFAQQVNANGTLGQITSVSENEILPAYFALLQNYPNPFNPITEISYQLPFQSEVQLTIFNMLGQEVKILVAENQPAGNYTIRWNGTDGSGKSVAGGVYLYRFSAGKDFVQIRKMVLVK